MTQNPNKINNEQAKQILTSMKVNETQAELIKSLKENTGLDVVSIKSAANYSVALLSTFFILR